MKKLLLTICFLLVLANSSCSPNAPAQTVETTPPVDSGSVPLLTQPSITLPPLASQTPTSLSNQVLLPSPLRTWTQPVTPTATSIATPTFIPTPSPTLFPTKEIFIQRARLWGDGGFFIDQFLGRDAPAFVIYTDGQMLLRSQDERRWYDETTLSVQEMCRLRSKIQESGFFNLKVPLDFYNYPENPIYKFDASMNFGDGASYELIQVRGSLNQTVFIYAGVSGDYPYTPLTDYLVPQVQDVRNLLTNFRPSGLTQLYQPKWAVLFMEKGRGELLENTDPKDWPVNLPALADLWEKRIPSSGFGWADVVVVEGQLLDQLLDLFDYNMANQLYIENGQEYSLILRPLLPHENLENIEISTLDAKVDLPFHCDGLANTPTAIPTVTRLPTFTPIPACPAWVKAGSDQLYSQEQWERMPKPPTAHDLIGFQYGSHPPEFQGVYGGTIDRSYVLKYVRIANRNLLWLSQMLCIEWGQIYFEVVNVLELPAIDAGDMLVIGDLDPGCRMNGVNDPELIAIAQIEEATPIFTNIKQAWRANSATGQFEPISTAGITCMVTIMDEGKLP